MSIADRIRAKMAGAAAPAPPPGPVPGPAAAPAIAPAAAPAAAPPRPRSPRRPRGLDANEVLRWVRTLDEEEYPAQAPVIRRIKKWNRPALFAQLIALIDIFLREDS